MLTKLLREAEEGLRPTNVAQVTHLSPFRYPGGKTWLVPEMRRWLSTMSRRTVFVEPFAGGASCGLAVAHEDLADVVVLGELDDDVAAVWQAVFESAATNKALCKRITSFEVTESNVRAVLSAEPRSVADRAWRTIIRNRMQRGGIMAPGAGLIKSGENGRGLASRWYPKTLVSRLETLNALSDKIRFHQIDAFELIARHADDRRAAFLIDPPYTAAGKRAGTRLYSHHAIDHERLFGAMAKVKGAAMITYDDTPEVVALAERHGFTVSRIPMKSSHHAVHKELMITRQP